MAAHLPAAMGRPLPVGPMVPPLGSSSSARQATRTASLGHSTAAQGQVSGRKWVVRIWGTAATCWLVCR